MKRPARTPIPWFFPALLLMSGTTPALSLTSSLTAPVERITKLPAAQDSLRKEKPRLMLLPILFVSPDTRWAAGVLPQIVFRTSPDSRPSTIRLDTYYTQNRQYHVHLQPSFWLENDAYHLTGRLSVKRWPTTYHGIGNELGRNDVQKFTEHATEVSLDASRRLRPGIYGGFTLAFRDSRIDWRETDAPSNRDARGAEGGFITGVGAGIRLDSRDNVFYPVRGNLFQFQAMASPTLLGSDFGFARLTLDLSRYMPVFKSHVLAIQGVTKLSVGSPPFRMLPGIGENLRGYSTVRYIDKNMFAVQAEYRFVPVAWRLGFTVFAGAGEVFSDVRDIRLDKLKYTAGFGIRFQFSRSEKINIRMDYGFGRDSSGDHIDLTEAF